MKIYIDFDGVILDTETHLFDEYYILKEKNKDLSSREYLEQFNWKKHIRESAEINNAIKILNQLKLDISVLTKVCSLQEANAKIEYLKNQGVTKPIITVPIDSKKCDIVDARGNLLIDDTVHNLDDWTNAGGKAIYFNKDNIDIDPWNNTNTKYQKVKSLHLLYDYK